jgi:tetratricopeptide (TPR) repeat protein
MNWKHLILALLFAGFLPSLHAQQTAIFTESNLAYKRGEEFFSLGLYGKARQEYRKAHQQLQHVSEPEYRQIRIRAELGEAMSAVRAELPDGEKLMLDFIRTHAPSPQANEALIELANFYYNGRKYDKAIEYFNQIPAYQLSPEKRSEVKFKTGYAYFVRKQFSQAKAQFRQVKDIDNDYYYPTNYYYGLCEFFDGNYSEAVRSFRLVERSRRFQTHVPYYIAQIYFAQGEYDQLIEYAEPRANSTQVSNLSEINQLVGQAYFEKGNYEKALPYLEFYAERSGRLLEEEFYQLGFTQYQLGKYDAARRNFEQLADVDSPMGQYALYYLADCYLRLNDRFSARNAFARAARMNYDAAIKEEALFNYGKLSYELSFDREALTAFQQLPTNSKYYMEAQGLLSDIFLKTQDYERALTSIENIPGRTPKMREAYQKVAHFYGLQLYRERQFTQARELFLKSNNEPIDANIKAANIYWMADIAHRERNYNESIRLMNQFLTLAKTLRDLPDESSVYTANYTQGYNYLKQENYNTAAGYFLETVNGINRNKPYIRSTYVKEQVLGDATMRAADCYFKRNQYTDAIRMYNEAISNKSPGFVYALFQKAIIEGLRGRTTEKILALESLIDNYPNSEYADDALFALGVTYQGINQFNNAIAPLRRLITDYKTRSNLVVQSLLRLGLISFNQGNLQTAIEYYKQVFSNNPEPSEAKEALRNLEEIYVYNLGDPDGYARFLATVPGYKLDNYALDSLTYRAGAVQYENGKYEQAIQNLTDYIRKFPNGANILSAHYYRGESFYQLTQYDKAFEDFEYVIGRGASRHYARSLRLAALIAYNHRQDFNKSLDLFTKLEQAATTEDIRLEAQVGAMQSAYRTGNASAVTSFAAKINGNPRATAEQKATANFFSGKLAFDRKDYAVAMNAFQQVANSGNTANAAESRYLLAEIFYLRRELSRAEEQCNRSIQSNSSYPYWVAKTMILLSDVYADMGDLLNARVVLEAIIDQYRGDQELLQQARTKLDQLNRRSQDGSRIDTNRNPFDLEDGN